MFKMLANFLKSLKVLLSRMYNALSTINQVASLPLSLEGLVWKAFPKGPSSRSGVFSLIFFLPALIILAHSVLHYSQ